MELRLNSNAADNKAFRLNSQAGTKYYKCQILGYDLGSSDVTPEYWGHCYGDANQAKKDFRHDVNEDLDGPLNYGFMVVSEYEVGEDHVGRPTGKRIVNNFGRWQTEETFFKQRFGYTHKEYLAYKKA